MKKLLFSLLMLVFFSVLKGQPADCVFTPPLITVNFGSGGVGELNTTPSYNYRRVGSSCPTDGHYAYTSYTSDCFNGDWHTLREDHTPGDADGNMMLVNASYYSGTFLTTTIEGLKSGTIYEFAVWMMNVCRISDKCPYPLLPDIGVMLQTPDGKVVAKFSTGELTRREAPQWTKYHAIFTMPPSETALTLTMTDKAPGGCGNDFVLDDIGFSECVIPKPIVTTSPKKPPVTKKPNATIKPKMTAPLAITKKKERDGTAGSKLTIKKQTGPEPKPKAGAPEENGGPQISRATAPVTPAPAEPVVVTKSKPIVFPNPPPLLTNRTNQLVKMIETPAGELIIDLYDNGEIDGDTVSVFHNNSLLVSNARLSQKAISFRIAINSAQPHHELVMVAHNLGSIPPNTSLMVVKAGTRRFEIFISSTEQKNAKVIFDLKE